MSELVAPYSKQHLYLVMHQYNKSDTPVLARAELQKDSSFFPASTNTYIACESFRLSLFGNPISGYVYQYVQPDWLIAADLDKAIFSSASKTLDDARVRAQEYDLRGSAVGSLKTFVNFIAYDEAGGNTFAHTADLSKIVECFASEFNENRISMNSEIAIHNRDALNTTGGIANLLNVKVTEKPTLKLTGPGFGRQGLGTMRGYFSTMNPGDSDGTSASKGFVLQTDADGPHGANAIGQPLLFQVAYHVEKTSLPTDFTKDDFAKYLSSGIRFYHRHHGQFPIFDVMGPYALTGATTLYEDDTLVVDGSAEETSDDFHVYMPNLRMYCNDNEFFQPDHAVNYKRAKPDTSIRQGHIGWPGQRNGAWVRETGSEYIASLTCRIHDNRQNNNARNYCLNQLLNGDVISQVDAWKQYENGFRFAIQEDGSADLDDEGNKEWRQYFAYSNDTTSVVKEYVMAKNVSVEVLPLSQQLNWNLDGHNSDSDTEMDDAEQNTWAHYSYAGIPIDLVNQTFQRERVEARSFSADPKGIMCVNELFEMFNIPELIEDEKEDNGTKAGQGLWTLQSHSNGGFVLTVNRDVSRFQITKSFADQLGLEPYITLIQNDKRTDALQVDENFILARYNTKTAAIHMETTDNFDNMVVEDKLSNYQERVDDDYERTDDWGAYYMDIVRSNYTKNDLLGMTVYHKDTKQPFKILNVATSSHHVTRTYKTKVAAIVKEFEGTIVYEWPNVPAGSVIGNTSSVSIESFSLFEGIQVTIPNLPFDPMITSYSNGQRAVCELRFPIPYNGGSNSTGRVVSTTDDKIGDLIWSVGGSGHQWLPVSSIGSIYSLAVQCNLVYRDANNIAPRPVYLPKNGIWQVKVVFLEVK